MYVYFRIFLSTYEGHNVRGFADFILTNINVADLTLLRVLLYFAFTKCKYSASLNSNLPDTRGLQGVLQMLVIHIRADRL